MVVVLQIVSWLLVLQLLNALTAPAYASCLRRAPELRPYFRTTGSLLLVGWSSWVGWSLDLLPNGAWGAGLCAALIGVAGWLANRSRAAVPRAGWGLGEGVFGVGFALGLALRLLDPAIDHTEEPMDFMMLSVVLAAESFPPEDPWLAGHALPYYYLGYWLLAVPARLLALPPEVAYNLGQATWLGMTCAGSFGIVHTLLVSAGASRRRARAGGTLAVVSVVGTASPAGAADALAELLSPSGGWWWWGSSRGIVDPALGGGEIELITEFPAFSFLLGDLHPHLLVLPLLLLVIALAFAGARGVERPQLGWLALALGGVLGTNPWSFPVALALLGPLLLARSGLRRAPAIVALALLSQLPLYPTLQATGSGLVPNLFFPTELRELGWIFGGFAPALVVLATWPRPSLRHGVAGFLGLLVVAGIWLGLAASGESPTARALALERWLASPGVLLVAALLVAGSLAPRESGASLRESLRLAGLLVAVGAGSVLVCELVYLRDAFGSRMNTVFKLYHSAWLTLALATAFAISVPARTPRSARALGTLSLAVILVGTLYLPLGIVSKRSPGSPLTLDGLAHLASGSPGELELIDWLRRELPPGARLLEAPGESYVASHSRLSAASARPTLLGWQGHELQWRGAAYGRLAAGRLEAIERAYTEPDAAKLAATLHAYELPYVIVGPRERARFGSDAGAGLPAVAERVYRHQGFEVWRVSRPSPLLR